MHDLRPDTRSVASSGPWPAAPPVVEIAVPVHNEERVLARSIERLHAYLADRFPLS